MYSFSLERRFLCLLVALVCDLSREDSTVRVCVPVIIPRETPAGLIKADRTIRYLSTTIKKSLDIVESINEMWDACLVLHNIIITRHKLY